MDDAGDEGGYSTACGGKAEVLYELEEYDASFEVAVGWFDEMYYAGRPYLTPGPTVQ